MIVVLIFGFSVITYFKTFFIEQKEAQIHKNSNAVIDYLAESKIENNKQEIVNWLSIIGQLNEGHAWLVNEKGVLEYSYPYSFDEKKFFQGMKLFLLVIQLLVKLIVMILKSQCSLSVCLLNIREK